MACKPPHLCHIICSWQSYWGIVLEPQAPHTRQEYEQEYDPNKLLIFLFLKQFRSCLARFLFMFLPSLYVGVGVPRKFLRYFVFFFLRGSCWRSRRSYSRSWSQIWPHHVIHALMCSDWHDMFKPRLSGGPESPHQDPAPRAHRDPGNLLDLETA